MEFVYRNNIILRGKVTKIITKKDGAVFVLSCGKSSHGRIKADQKGRFLREVVAVRFFDEQAQKCLENFHIGDFVATSGVVQNIKDRYNRKDRVEIWGFNMFPSEEWKDMNSVSLQGIIDNSVKISDDYVLLNLKTAVTHKRKNLRENAKFDYFEETYRSITPVGVRCKKDASDQLKRLTKGTWISLEGFVYGRILKKNEEEIRVQRIVTNESQINIIGEVQRLVF